MNNKNTAKATTTIHAPVSKVWQALVNPEIIKQYLFNTDVISDWQRPSYDITASTIGVFDGDRLVAYADHSGEDVAYSAVHPDYQGQGLGKAIVLRLRDLSKHHRKIILYAAPGKDAFYLKLGFKRMLTAMAIFQDQVQAVKTGLVAE